MKTRWVIHPQLVMQIHTGRQRYHDYFRNEYEQLEASDKQKDALKIRARIVRRLPEAESGDIRRTLRFKRIFRYEYVVRGLTDDAVDVYFRDSLLGMLYSKMVTLFLQAQVLEPIAYYKLLERNILFMHAAGVSDGEHGYLLPAYGGTGKTTLTLGLMGEGMEVLGDDLLLVDADSGDVAPYLRPLHVFTYNVKTLRDAQLPWSLRMTVRAKDLLRIVLQTVTREEFLISTRVHAQDIYPDLLAASEVPFRRIVFLVKEGKDQVLSTQGHIDELVDRVLDSEDLNDSLYENIIDPADKERVVELERSVIRKVLAHVPEVWIINTRNLDFRNLAEFKERLTGKGQSSRS